MTIIVHLFIVYWPFLVPIALMPGVVLLCLRLLRSRTRECFIGTLTAAQRKTLLKAGIKCRSGLTGNNRYGLFINRKSKAKALKALNATVIGSKFGSGKEEKLETLTLSFGPEGTPQEERTIHFLGQFLQPQSAIADAATAHLMPLVKGNLFIYGKGSPHPPAENDGNFHLILSCSSEPEYHQIGHAARVVNCNDHSFSYNGKHSYNRFPPATIWRKDVTVKLKTRAPSPLAIPYRDHDTGFYPLERLGNRLYLLFEATEAETARPNWFQRMANKLSGTVYEPRLPLLEHCLQHWGNELNEENQLQEYLRQQGIEEPPVHFLNDDGAPLFSINTEDFIENNEQLRRPLLLASLAAQILSPFCRSGLTMINGAGKFKQQILSQGELVIFYRSAWAETRKTQSPNRYWGERALQQETLFGPSTRGLPLYTPEGIAVGELFHDTLYVFPELMLQGTSAEARLWAVYLLAARKLMTDSRSQSREDLLADAFSQECIRQLGPGAGSNTVSPGEIKTLTDKMESSLRTAGKLQEAVHLAELMPYKDLGEEFDSILAIPKVTNVKVTEKTIIVSTETLYCVNPSTGTRHVIGPFEINIDPSNVAGLRWFNKSGRSTPQGMNAPHVSSEGKACFGNTAETFSQLISARQYAAVVEVAIAFVESVNVTDTWGKRIVEWPVASQQG